MLYWSCESKKIAHGSTCTRIDFLPMVFLLLSFVVVVVCVRRHRSMIPIFSSIFKYLFFSTIKKKRRREKKRYISLSNVRRRKNRYTNIFFSHRFIIMIGASLSHLFFSLFDRLSTNEHEYFTYLIVVSNKIKEEVLYPQGKIDTFILTLLDTFFIIERRSSEKNTFKTKDFYLIKQNTFYIFKNKHRYSLNTNNH